MAKKTKADFISLLRVRTDINADRQTAVLNARIIGLGHGNVCGRCGGSGNYSFNTVDGTTCFGCLGSGYVAAKLTSELYNSLEALVNDGSLDKFLVELRARVALKTACKNAVDVVMSAWGESKVSSHYDWMKSADGIEPHRVISTEVNKPMCDAYNAVLKATQAVDSLSFKLKKAETAEQREEIQAQITVAISEALAVRDQGLETIEAGKVRLTEILAEWPDHQGR